MDLNEELLKFSLLGLTDNTINNGSNDNNNNNDSNFKLPYLQTYFDWYSSQLIKGVPYDDAIYNNFVDCWKVLAYYRNIQLSAAYANAELEAMGFLSLANALAMSQQINQFYQNQQNMLNNSVTQGTDVENNLNEDVSLPNINEEGWCRNKKYIEKIDDNYMCKICKKQYSRYNSVSYHVTTYHRNPKIECNEPGCKFSTREARYIHFHKYYRHNIPLPDSVDLANLTCHYCGHVAKSPKMVEKHLRKHDGEIKKIPEQDSPLNNDINNERKNSYNFKVIT
ncbi:Zinc finger, C2H2 domain and Zinc finger, C2H2-like domain-containing protein [Strongyloides ratti]|uniref:Zinc finger, C2H2 domain and Zinc finger, C2H2-like domain-containing protein n=1 Tax=Strongyloides ratti TaxID=34506 RepID=A0A090L2P9_STRRB|nr:Zinc finger, C2H2 domain and Zinc finger, C2H2-like domain-containing protein [Strongyloides ratti]CEF63982.2 Zinc finger, C2H2 domain and Zinc finger, C2H2-like domain-containing protein [Strongyloides ratti]